MAGVDFYVVLQVVLFIFCVWATGRLFKACRLAAMLGYLLCGILMGPAFFDVVPYASSGTCDTIVTRRLAEAAANLTNATDGSGSAHGSVGGCDDVFWGRWLHLGSPRYIDSVWVFIGNVGVTLMIFQSGMHMHFDKVRQVGLKTIVVAVLGTVGPLLVGMAVVGGLFGGEFYPSGFAAGSAFAPTSIDISIKLLEEAKMLNSLAGQMTITAAFIDDIFALGMLVLMQNLAAGETGREVILLLFVSSFGFLVVGVLLALYVYPHLPKLLAKVPPSKYASVQPRDEIHLFLMVCTLCLCAYLTSIHGFIGNHLLGAFVAGMCFVRVPRSRAVWDTQMKRIVKWMVRFFFASSVGFAVPVEVMFTWEVFGKGLVLGIGPTIAMKIIAGVAAWMKYASPAAEQRARDASWVCRHLRLQPQQLLVGMAMVPRGEFAFVIVEAAYALDYVGGAPGQRMMPEKVYASSVWALVLATIASPLLFRWALGVYSRATPIVRSRTITSPRASRGVSLLGGGGDDVTSSHVDHAFVIRVASRHHIGVHRELLGSLHASGVDVLEVHVLGVDKPNTVDLDAFVASFVVISRGARKDFDDEKLEEMQHVILEILDDADAQVIFEPYDDDFSQDGAIEIQVLVQHHPDILHEITDALATMQLDVFKADVTHTSQPTHGSTTVDLSRSSSFSRPSSRSAPATASRPSSHNASGRASPVLRLEEEARDRALERGELYAHGVEMFALEEKERAVFYAREADGTHQFSATRRAEIQAELERIVHEHGLKGTIVLRVVHESQMALAHPMPKFDHEDAMAVIRCTGAHHKELLHEICDTLHASSLDVLHAEMDQNDQGAEEHSIFVIRTDGAAMSGAQRTELRASINDLYRSHGKEVKAGSRGVRQEEARVSVLPLRGKESARVSARASAATPADVEVHVLGGRLRDSASPAGTK